MRAAARALPLLRPGFSLAFATLPAGQDPDDLVRAQGADGFTAILDDAQPLVERLWAHEVAAGPLATPEERAALKTRLLTRPEGRRLGKEWVWTVYLRWWPYLYKNNKNT